MSSLDSLATWIESTRVARTVGGSMWLVASLSALHVLGYAIVMAGALATNLRLLGVMPSVALRYVIAPASRSITIGLVISLVTGILLVSWKAVAAFGNDLFRIKMLLLLAALVSHFAWQARLANRSEDGSGILAGAIGALVWLGLAVAAAAYILFE
jgi:hypothetical protein